jgi:hypothetical protein
MQAFSVEQSILEGEHAVKELFQFVQEQAEESEAYQMESTIFEKLHKIGLAAMTCYFATKGTGDVGSDLSLANGTVLKRESGFRGRDYFSVFGKLKVPRTCYRAVGHRGLMPLDAQANLPKRCYSYLLQEWMDLLSLRDGFAESSLSLEKLLRLDVKASRLEVVNQESVDEYDQFYHRKDLPDAESEGELQVLSFDGKGVPVIKREAAKLQARLGKGEKRQKKKEAMVGVSYTIDRHVHTPEEVAENLVYPERAKKRREEQKRVVCKHALKGSGNQGSVVVAFVPPASHSAEVGQAEVGQVEVGQVEVGQVEVGQAEVGQAEVGQVEVGQVEVGQVEQRPPEHQSTSAKSTVRNSSSIHAQNVRRLASLERPKKEVMQEIVQDAERRNPEQQRPYVVVMDGALRLWNAVTALLVGIAWVGVLDIIHGVEYLWDVGNALYGEKTPETEQWVYESLLSILRGQVKQVIEELEQTLNTLTLKASQQKTLTDTIRYFTNHEPWMHYDDYLKAGYPIGSGVVESTCGHTVKDRMEGAGRRWSVEGAESTLLLRSIYTSDDWDAYWDFRMAMEKENLYHEILGAVA